MKTELDDENHKMARPEENKDRTFCFCLLIVLINYNIGLFANISTTLCLKQVHQ